MAKILMMCHDQYIDRRIVAQANVLIKQGHSVTLIALAHGNSDQNEILPEGIRLVRIGLHRIVPENATYLAYMKRQRWLGTNISKLANCRFSYLSRCASATSHGMNLLNWNYYTISLLLRYQNRRLHDPLPFRKAFFETGCNYKADIVQVHDLPALQAGVEVAKEWNVPLVYDAHELYPEQRPFSRVQRRICSVNEARFIKEADLVFTVNDSIAEEMAKRYQITKPVVLLNAVDPPSIFNPNARYNLIREKLGLSHSEHILLFQGGFAPHRNLRALVKAIADVNTSTVRLVLLGFGDFRKKLEELASRLGLLNRKVYFLDAVPQSELLQYSASADIGVIPYPHVDLNSFYCTPNKLFEFIQAGLPIIANDSPELRRFVDENGFGLVHDMKTPQKIAEAIDMAFAETQNLTKWREVLVLNRQKFSWAVEAAKFLNAYRGVLTGGPTRHII